MLPRSPKPVSVMTAGAVLYLRQNVGALLQQRDRRLAQAGGQLHPQQLLLLGEVVLQGVSQGHSGAPVRKRVC